MAAAVFTAPPAAAQQPAPLASCSLGPVPNVEVARTSVYVPMADGVRLAVDVFLPKDRPPTTKLPVLLVATRYWRAHEGQEPGPIEKYWIGRGYALVSADVRGTGASFGQWYYPWAEQEVKDLGALVQWAARQPWSTGRVGTYGTSYTGNTAQLAAAYGGPALKAMIPRFMDFDVYTDLTQPGGIINRAMIEDWGSMIHAMDMNEKSGNPPRGVRPVDEDTDGKLLAAAVADHQKNPPLNRIVDVVNFRDDRVAQFGGKTIDASGTYLWRRQIEASKVPIFGWASWMDAGTSQGVINRFRTWSNPQTVVIGPWSHGGGNHTDPFLPTDTPTDPPSATQLDQATCFLDQYVKGTGGPFGERTVIYYTMGEGKWKKTSVWPVAGTSTRRWYLGANGSLTASTPATPSGTDQYRVDFDVGTGPDSRWHTQLGGFDVIYPDRAEIDRRLLTYTSDPLERDVEVTGQGVITLYLASTATDGDFIVYLEDVASDGRVTYIQEGHLRGIQRKVSTEPPPYRILYPYHTFKKKDGQPLVPGQVAKLAFQLYPTSVLFKAGHRIRIALAGADKDNFARTPATGEVTWTVSHTRAAPSSIELPVVTH
jgi:putative CocE/NonD family hydrolase